MAKQGEESFEVAFTDVLQQQEAHMASFSRQVKAIQGFSSTSKPVSVMQIRLKILQDTWATMQDLHMRLVCFDPATTKEHHYFKNDLYGASESQYLDIMDVLATLIEKAQQQPAAGGSSSGYSPFAATESQQGGHHLDHLPKISLPVFSGKYTEWAKYRAYFESLIVKNNSIDQLQKLHYLLSSLSGEPRELLRTTTFAAESFVTAWKLLNSRYDNSRSIVTAHITSLLSLPSVKSESVESLRSLRNRVTEIIVSLESAERFSNVAAPAAIIVPGVHGVSDILVCIIASKLDHATRRAWEMHLGDDDNFPHYSKMDKFLAARIRGLEAYSNLSSISTDSVKRTVPMKFNQVNSHVVETSYLRCPFCKQSHSIYTCAQFKALSASNRFKHAKNLKLCINCLGSKHFAAQCTSTRACNHCQGKHHTMLHAAGPTASVGTALAPAADSGASLVPPAVQTHFVAPSACGPSRVLLATAHVLVTSSAGRTIKVRALLDQGSTRSFVTQAVVSALKVPTLRGTNALMGIGGTTAGASTYIAPISIGSKTGHGPLFHTDALVLKTLTSYVPQIQVPNPVWPHLAGLNLADDHPTESDPVQIIIGADLYGSLLLEGLVQGHPSLPIAQNTALGWVLSGPSATTTIVPDDSVTVLHAISNEELHDSLSRFWEIENVPTSKNLTLEESQCENHFKVTHSRTDSGQYVVRLPFKSSIPIPIGYSRHNAIRSLNSLSRRLDRNVDINQKYTEFINEYETLNHMQRVNPSLQEDTQTVYLIHHPVVKLDSTTTQLRVVFNASALTTNFTSLNSHLMTGPKLQSDLFNILTQWRAYRFVFSADIAKMYRQILVHPADRDYQRILWKSHPTAPIQEFQLSTITYGTSCAPYLALRVLEQLVLDEGHAFPLGSKVLKRFRFVDDCLFGADQAHILLEMRQEVSDLLSQGHFILRKWGSNDETLLAGIDQSNHGLAWSPAETDSFTIKLLGLSWNPRTDVFHYKVVQSSLSTFTKRVVLSIIASLYDPLGWISPVIILAKIFMQDLWRHQLGWDEHFSVELTSRWTHIYDDLSYLTTITIPRWTSQHSNASCSIHGFSDASSFAYAAVVYIQCIDQAGIITTSLLASKTRVAPLKTQSIPHLELSGAVLLAQLLVVICAIPEYAHLPQICWTDSTIVLAWLRSEPAKRAVFVANRVSKIQTSLPTALWRHVPTYDNPADAASRGVKAQDLALSSLWWHGPPWLSQTQSSWPPNLGVEEEASPSEILTIHHVCRAPENAFIEELAIRYSSWIKLIRITAYLFRVSQRLCNKVANHATPQVISADEIQASEEFWFKYLQRQWFSVDIANLSEGTSLPSNHPLSALDPFIDNSGILRVGGRLSRSDFNYTMKHPIILKDHPTVRLYISYIHQKCLHGGLQLTLRTLRQKAWIIRARHLVRSVLSKCVMCARLKAASVSQLMGALPPARVLRPERAFQHSGVDYAGPLLVREVKGRGKRAHPAYIAVFVCMSVRAVHLELVMDYSSSAFLAAFRRFISRRGTPQCMYSDRGTTFQGAQSEIKTIFNAAKQSTMFQGFLAENHVTWKFIPPAAPHFGGLWEAGVRSLKHHLRRVLGSHTPTIEELTTLLCQIEACLNSRPISPLTDHPDDLAALTPGHFLVGGEITSLPEPTLLEVHANRLDRWQLYQQMLESFWKQWSLDYVTSLQQRSKWRTRNEPVRVGQMVLVRHENVPPTKWQLGRIVHCHPGVDDLTRVVSIRTATTTLVRPLAKLALLPIIHDNVEISNETSS